MDSPLRTNRNTVFWEAIPSCVKSKCPLYATCLYPKNEPCGLRKKYLLGVERLILDSISKKDARARLKVGLELVPLYNQLFAAKMALLKKETPENAKEVRETIRNIEMVFRTIEVVDNKVSGGDDSVGGTDYYDQLISAAEEDEAVDPPKKPEIKKKKSPRRRFSTKRLEKEFDIT